MGRCPELKSDEFSLWNPLHVEISKCEDSFTVNKVLHLFGASVRGAERLHGALGQGGDALTGLEAHHPSAGWLEGSARAESS